MVDLVVLQQLKDLEVLVLMMAVKAVDLSMKLLEPLEGAAEEAECI